MILAPTNCLSDAGGQDRLVQAVDLLHAAPVAGTEDAYQERRFPLVDLAGSCLPAIEVAADGAQHLLIRGELGLLHPARERLGPGLACAQGGKTGWTLPPGEGARAPTATARFLAECRDLGSGEPEDGRLRLATGLIL